MILTPIVVQVLRMLPQSARSRLHSPIARKPLDEDGGALLCSREGVSPPAIIGATTALEAESPGEKRQLQQGGAVRHRRGATWSGLSGTRNVEVGAPAGGTIPHAAPVSEDVLALSGPDKGLVLRPGGYPCDADAVRRYICYCFVVFMTVLWHETAKAIGLA